MGSTSKKSKNKDKEVKESRKRHRSSSVEIIREKEKRRHHHHNHHKKHQHSKEKKHKSRHSYDSEDSDVVLAPSPPQITRSESPPPPPTITIKVDSSPEPSPEREKLDNRSSGGAGSESLSIEETNRLRSKLGLKPLQVDTTTENKDGRLKDDLGEFYHKPAANIAHKTYQEKIRSKLSERKDRRKYEEKLAKTKTLGESDSDDDPNSWVEKNRQIQREKEQAAKRAKVLEELDEELGLGQLVEAATREQRNKAYSQKSLKGLRVEHDVESFQEGSTIILTLKDKAILEDDEDVLVNVNLVDNEHYKKHIEQKKRKLDYNPYDNEELDEFGMLKRKDVLSKYDEEIDGEQKKSFTIGNDNSVERRQKALMSIKAKLANKRIESLTLPELKIASDYYSEAELTKFKKPKKKVRKIRQKGKMLKVDELEAQLNAAEGNMNDYLKDLGSRRKRDSDNYLDIDDVPNVNIKPENVKIEPENNELELALHKARISKLKNPKNPATIIEQVKLEHVEQEMSSEDTGNIVLNSTAEFCRTLGDIPTYGRAGNRDEEEDLLDFERELKYSTNEPMDTENGMSGSWVAVDTDGQGMSSTRVSEIINQEAPILDEEPDVGSGVAAALQLAMSKGYLDKEDTNRPSTSRFAHLQAKNYSIEDKAHGDDDKFGRRDRYSGPTMDFKEKDSYKPNVKLDYIDDEGHVLNAKEAFRYLSHKFHGKGPGKNKIEKRIKKNEQEGLMKKMSSTDTPLGTLNMLQAKQKETQSAYIVLSGSKHTHSTNLTKMKR